MSTAHRRPAHPNGHGRFALVLHGGAAALLVAGLLGAALDAPISPAPRANPHLRLASSSAPGPTPGHPFDRLAGRRAVGQQGLELATVNSQGSVEAARFDASATPLDQVAVAPAVTTSPRSGGAAPGGTGDVQPALVSMEAAVMPSGDAQLTDQSVLVESCGATHLCLAVADSDTTFDTGIALEPGSRLEATPWSVADQHQGVVVVYRTPDGGTRVAGFRLDGYTGGAPGTWAAAFDRAVQFVPPGDAGLGVAVGDFVQSGSSEQVAVTWLAPDSGIPGTDFMMVEVFPTDTSSAPVGLGLKSASYFLYGYTTTWDLAAGTQPVASPAVYAGKAYDVLTVTGRVSNGSNVSWATVPVGVSDAGVTIGPPQALEMGSNLQVAGAGDLDGNGTGDLALVSAAGQPGACLPGDTWNSTVTVGHVDLDAGGPPGTVPTIGQGNNDGAGSSVSVAQPCADGQPMPISVAVGNASPLEDQSVLPDPADPAATAAQIYVAGTHLDNGAWVVDTWAFEAENTASYPDPGVTFQPASTGPIGASLPDASTTVLKNGTYVTTPSQPLIAAGFWKGRDLVGAPVLHQSQEIDPVVVLNAPPTHFDVVGGRTLDVNRCYGADLPGCPFTSTYTQTSSSSITVSATTSEDWQVNTDVSGSATYGVGSVSADLSASVGQHFDHETDTNHTTTITVQARATDDDAVYALTVHYDVLEYPVYNADNHDLAGNPTPGTPVGYVAAVTPSVTSHDWINASGPLAQGYLNPHVPGDILSYPTDTSQAQNPNMPDNAQVFGQNNYELSPTSSYDYTLDKSTFTNDQASTTTNAGVSLSVSGSVGVEGVAQASAGVTGSFDYQESHTRSTQVGSDISVESSLGSVDGSLGADGYRVRPFVYYDTRGALVLDYAVTPDLATDGTQTLWQSVYGHEPDLTFSMPHLLDPEKGLALATNEQRYETSDLGVRDAACDSAKPGWTSPGAVIHPGDEICLSARVHDFSLVDAPVDVPVRFYAGDPRTGGSPIGTTTTTTAPPARGSAIAQISWTVPASYGGALQRIYAEVDPGDAVSEVHEHNNIGWTPVQLGGSFGVPAPSYVTATADHTTATIGWQSADPAGASYTVTAYPGGASTTTTGDQATISGLTPGQTYEFSVVAAYGGDTSPVSNPSEPITIDAGVAGQPANLTATAGSGRATLSWVPPTTDGGNPITGYVIGYTCPQGATGCLPGSPVSEAVNGNVVTATVPGLTNGATYAFTVAAVNSAGTGPASAPSNQVTPVAPPGRPTAVVAVAGPLSAEVRWSPPDDTGGAPVDHYTVTSHPSGFEETVPGSRTAAVMTGLQAGVSYDFTVRATSRPAGQTLTGPASVASNRVVPTKRATALVARVGPRPITEGQATTLAARLVDLTTGTGLGGRRLVVREREPGSSTWTTVARPTTDATGRLTLRLAPRHSVDVRVGFAGTPALGRASSRTIRLGVGFAVTGGLSRTRAAPGTRVTVRGRIAPDAAGQRVLLQERRPTGWVTLLRTAVTPMSSYRFPLRLHGGGRHHLRVWKPASTRNLGGAGPTLLLRIG